MFKFKMSLLLKSTKFKVAIAILAITAIVLGIVYVPINKAGIGLERPAEWNTDRVLISGDSGENWSITGNVGDYRAWPVDSGVKAGTGQIYYKIATNWGAPMTFCIQEGERLNGHSASDASTGYTASTGMNAGNYSNYSAAKWLVDNMYIKGLPGESQEHLQSLASLIVSVEDGVNEGQIMYFANSASGNENAMTVINQIALWQYTNNLQRDSISIPYSQGIDLQNMPAPDTARHVYNGLIKLANAHNVSSYSNIGGAKSYELVSKDAQVNESNYRVGPYYINMDGAQNTANVLNTYQNNIQITITRKDGTTTVNAGSELIEQANGAFYINVEQYKEDISKVDFKITGLQVATEPKTVVTTYSNSSYQDLLSVNRREGSGSKSVSLQASMPITPTDTPTPKIFDLALRKYITKVNGQQVAVSREPIVNVQSIKDLLQNGTASYVHPKNSVEVAVGDEVEYTLRIYNEGEILGYEKEITDYLPVGLTFVKIADESANMYSTETQPGSDKVVLNYKGNSVIKSLRDFANSDSVSVNGEYYHEVKLVCKVQDTDKKYITNRAEITVYGYPDENGQFKEAKAVGDVDVDSVQNTIVGSLDLDNWHEKENASDSAESKYYPGVQDDDDFETVRVKKEDRVEKKFDLALRKYITKVNGNNVETSREPVINKQSLADLLEKGTASYIHPKNSVEVSVGDEVEYTLRVYNEGDIKGYAKEITDFLPDGLMFEKIADESATLYSTTSKSGAQGSIVLTYNGNTPIESLKSLSTIGRNVYSVTDKYYQEVKVICKVKDTDKKYITNRAEITNYGYEEKNDNGDVVWKEAKEIGNVDIDSVQNTIKDALDLDNWHEKENANDSSESRYYPGVQDDDDFETVKIREERNTKKFDLALRKYITKIDGKELESSRVPVINAESLKNLLENGTASYYHPKNSLEVSVGSQVEYTLRVYNEGDIEGYAKEITDYLPDGLVFVKIADESAKQYTTSSKAGDKGAITLNYNGNTTIKSLKSLRTVIGKKLYNITGDYYQEVKVICKVENTGKKYITNRAEITKYGYPDDNGEFKEAKGIGDVDRDSVQNTIKDTLDLDKWHEKQDVDETGKEIRYYPGVEDDDDFETVRIKEEEEEKKFDLALRKYITKIDGKELESSRVPVINAESLKNLLEKGTASYYHPKNSLEVSVGSQVEYTLRVYNEGDIEGYAKEITDYLPDGLVFVKIADESAKQYTTSSKAGDKGAITLSYKGNTKIKSLKSLKTVIGKKLYNITGEYYQEVKVVCKVEDTEKTYITNRAEITKYGYPDDSGKFKEAKEIGNVDRDSVQDTIKDKLDLDKWHEKQNVDETGKETKYYPGEEDDDDFETIKVKPENREFDLALRKFITAVNGEKVKESREPQVDVSELVSGKSTTATYKHTKDPVLVNTTDIVSYTIRVYNEGEVDGYATKVMDDIPVGLEFLPDNDVNKQFKWIMYKEDSSANENDENVLVYNEKKYVVTNKVSEAEYIVTDYLSMENGDSNLIKAFNKETKQLDYRDLEVVFKVVEPSTSKRIVTNYAQITKHTDTTGKPVKDRDSVPNQWNKGEDDQDLDNVKVKYFDLALRKWVTKAIIYENGYKTVTETKHGPWDEPEPVVKVDLKDKNLNNVEVKFEYTIRVYNQGEVEGYAKEISDYIPEGLKFVKADNPDWTEVDGKIVTKALENTLLKTDEYADVKVVLTWINGANNLGLKTNVAEISKDYNEYGTPDIDSTPNNKVPGEDDIDDAKVILAIKTGAPIVYTGIAVGVIAVISLGVVLIRKRVL